MTTSSVSVETLIIGGGIIGSSVAMHLAQLGMTDIRVVDFDLEGSLSSSELNAGGVRATWQAAINVAMSKLSIEYFAKVAHEIGYRPCGYLWLHSPKTWEAALEARKGQLAQGWPVEALDLAALKRKVPFIDKAEGIQGATFSPRDGLVNPNLLKNHYREKSKALGVCYDDRTLVKSASYSDRPGGNTKRVEVVAERFEQVLSYETKKDILTASKEQIGSGFARQRVTYHANYVIHCTGPWANQVASFLGYHSPSYPQRRQISIFDCKELDLTPYGMIVDTSGVYFHPEASNILAGYATPGEPPSFNYSYDVDAFFQGVIWPALYERSTAFERLKHLTGWSGLYEVSPDDGGILGQVTNGEAGKSGAVFEVHSFSGHGVMQSYAAGLAIAEKIVKGRYETLDAEELSARRFEEGTAGKRPKLIDESLVI